MHTLAICTYVMCFTHSAPMESVLKSVSFDLARHHVCFVPESLNLLRLIAVAAAHIPIDPYIIIPPSCPCMFVNENELSENTEKIVVVKWFLKKRAAAAAAPTISTNYHS